VNDGIFSFYATFCEVDYIRIIKADYWEPN
jgi:hypothetical protein